MAARRDRAPGGGVLIGSEPRETEVRRRTPAAITLAAGGVLALAAIVLRSPVPLLLALPLLIAPALAAFSAPPEDGIARLRWSDAGEGAEVRLVGTLAVPDGTDPRSLTVRFYRPAPLTEEAPPELRAGDGGLAFTTHWRAPYPCLAVVPLPEVRWTDPLGLAETRRPVEGRALRVERFPPEVRRLSAVRLRRTTPLPGEVRARSLGPAGEFFTLRAAAGGDPVRRINWQASARQGRLLVNEFAVERTGDILLVLDERPTSLGAERDAALLALSASAALGIATGFLAEKARVGLALYDEFLTAIPLGSGRLQRHRIARALTSARVGSAAGPSERLAVSLRRYFPPGVTTVLFTPLADDDGGLLLSHLRRRGFPVAVLSPSPIPLFVAAGAGRGEDDALATRLLALARRQRIADTWREAPVVDWDDYWSLAGFVRFLSTPVLERRRS